MSWEQVIIPCVSGWILKPCVSGNILGTSISVHSVSNMEVSAGYIGQPIGQDNKNAFQYTLNVQGRLLLRAIREYYHSSGTGWGNASPERYCANRFGVCFLYSVVSRLKKDAYRSDCYLSAAGLQFAGRFKGVKAKMEESGDQFSLQE